MRRVVGGIGLVAIALATAVAVPVAAPGPSADAASVRDVIAGTHCTAFPADNFWHADVSKLPIEKHSAAWLSHMSTDRNLHPDFGGPYGIPVTVVAGGHPKVRVGFDYADESDRAKYPLGRDTRVEGGRNSGGDMHTITVDKRTCTLYETWDTSVTDSRWRAGSGAIWKLTSDALRPDGWTSADAAGLPILPGLLRYSEVKRGRIDHAIRFTTDVTSKAHLWPARHDAGSKASSTYPPMGALFRLNASFSTAGMSRQAKTVVAAMKTYGLVLADNGSPWFFQGERNSHWSNRLLDDLKTIPASAFVAVDTRSLKVSTNSGATK